VKRSLYEASPAVLFVGQNVCLAVDFALCVILQSFSAGGADQFEEEELDDEELGHAETYADYMPAKCEPNLPVQLYHVCCSTGKKCVSIKTGPCNFCSNCIKF